MEHEGVLRGGAVHGTDQPLKELVVHASKNMRRPGDWCGGGGLARRSAGVDRCAAAVKMWVDAWGGGWSARLCAYEAGAGGECGSGGWARRLVQVYGCVVRG